MNFDRIIKRSMSATVLAVTLATSTFAFAQLERKLPQDVRQGRMSYAGNTEVIVDGYAAALTAGAQIRNEQNLIIMPAALPAYSLVRFQEDNEGRIHRVWVLREDESAVPLKLPGKIQRQ